MDPIIPTDCFYYLVSRTSLAATSLLKREFCLEGVEEVKPAYLGVLMVLWTDDDLAIANLGRRAGLEPSSMTGLLDRMERDKLIARCADPSDRRTQRISLTEQGVQLQEAVMSVVDRTLAKITRGIAEDDLAQTREILQTFLANTLEEKSVG